MNRLGRGRDSRSGSAGVGSALRSANRATPSNTRRPSAGRVSGSPSVMTQGHPHAEWLGGLALAPELEPAGLLVRDPAVGPDIVQALQHQSRRDEQGADLRDHLGHHREGDDRQAFQSGSSAETRRPPSVWFSATGSPAGVKANRVVIARPGSHCQDLADPRAWLGDGVVGPAQGRRIAQLQVRGRRRLRLLGDRPPSPRAGCAGSRSSSPGIRASPARRREQDHWRRRRAGLRGSRRVDLEWRLARVSEQSAKRGGRDHDH